MHIDPLNRTYPYLRFNTTAPLTVTQPNMSRTVFFLVVLVLIAVAQAQQINCSARRRPGRCRSRRDCINRNMKPVPGVCPDGDDSFCCITATCQTNGFKGSCVSQSDCNGLGRSGVPGVCKGGNVCCIPRQCRVQGQNGRCLTKKVCRRLGGDVSQLCPGQSRFSCCLGK